MRNTIYVLIALITCFMSCDGRKTQKKSLSESIDAFNINNEVIISNYIPENYYERTVDSTLTNGFDVKIMIKSSMTDDAVLIKEKNDIKYATNYRHFNFSINVKKNGHTIYYKAFDKNEVIAEISKLKNYRLKGLPKDFNKLSVLKSIQLNQELSISEDSIYIDIAYAKPNHDVLDLHTLKINKDGTSNFIQFIN